MPLIDPGDLPSVGSLHRSRRLAGAEIAAIAEGGEHISFGRVLELGIQTGQRTEEARPLQQVFGVGKSIEDRGLRHLLSDRRFEPGEPDWRLLARHLGKHGLSVLDADGVIFWKSTVCLLRDLTEPPASFGDELLRIVRYAGLLLVGRA